MGDKYDEMAERLWDKLGPKYGVLVPETYIRDIASALRAAVDEEREACACHLEKLADEMDPTLADDYDEDEDTALVDLDFTDAKALRSSAKRLRDEKP